ncbi:PEP/pyruvate-binding domain-containing protein [Melioribacter sp. OK-6-Me]|uniref:PEP/pyruvate-binding domain-containing protein n=1 Tax=unclassified Melioribacter TaxID=2627329 RepID=UPI003ED91600
MNNISKFFSHNSHLIIGKDEVGGKAAGLLSASSILHKIKKEIPPTINLFIPGMVIIASDIFDKFIERNELLEYAIDEDDERYLNKKFLSSVFPNEYLGELYSILNEAKFPLAVRSSGLLEDSQDEPLAGIYKTKMINPQPGAPNLRFNRLIDSIKFVYASVYSEAAKNYFSVSGYPIEREKMAVILQRVAGEKHYNRFYPDFSGVAKSYNFYPFGKARPVDGIVHLALGLGKTIVDGDIVWSYSPAFPKHKLPYKNNKDLLNLTQKKFWAIDISSSVKYDPLKETEFLLHEELSTAEYDNVLKNLASTYVTYDDKIIMGLGYQGPRIVDFSPLIELNMYGFNDFMKILLNNFETEYKVPVEIEFACWQDYKNSILNFAFLQVRPMKKYTDPIEEFELNVDNVVLKSNKVLGNGIIEGIDDIVIVKRENFDMKNSTIIADQISQMNKKFIKEYKKYILIGFGRWGTADPWLGIPVEWSNVNAAKVIIEINLMNLNVEFSQGSHFFHNLLNLDVPYFSLNYDTDYIDWEWIEKQRTIDELKFVKHIKADSKLIVKVDGKKGKGVILR